MRSPQASSPPPGGASEHGRPTHSNSAPIQGKSIQSRSRSPPPASSRVSTTQTLRSSMGAPSRTPQRGQSYSSDSTGEDSPTSGNHNQAAIFTATASRSHSPQSEEASDGDSSSTSGGRRQRGNGGYTLRHPWTCPGCAEAVTSARSIAVHLRDHCASLRINISADPVLLQHVKMCRCCDQPYSKGTGYTQHVERCLLSSASRRRNNSGQGPTPTSSRLPLQSAAQRPTTPRATTPTQHPNTPVPPPPPPPQQLRTQAMRGVYKIPKKHVESMARLSSRFLNAFVDVVEGGGQVEGTVIDAFLALPDIFLECKKGADRARLVASLQRLEATGPDDLAEAVLAASLQVKHRIPPTQQRRAKGDLPTTRLKYLLRNNCAGKAARLLEAHVDKITVADLEDVEVRRKTQALFPAASDKDLLPQGLAAPRLPVVTLEVVQTCLQSLPKQSANGMSSWTYDLIRQIGTDNVTFAEATQRFINVVWTSGRGGDPLLWTRSRAVVLGKPDGGLRPIAVGEAWTRFAARALVATVAPSLVQALAPLQWGIGVPGGAEVVAHACSLFLDVMEENNLQHTNRPSLCIQQVDFENAFNSVGRRAIYDGLATIAPSLLEYFRWSYGCSSPIYTRDGSLLCESATGVRQGDPLGPLFFCVALQPILRAIRQRFPNCFTPTYMDDIHLLGPVRDMPEIMEFTKSEAAEIGLRVKESKCAQYESRFLMRSPDSPTVGLVCLGKPLGTIKYVGQHIRQQLTAFQRPLSILPQLEAVVAFPILQACINARPIFLARTVQTPLLRFGISQFDNAVDRCLGAICGWSGAFPNTSSAIRSLPSSLGGCGLRRLGPIAALAWSASFSHACHTIAKLDRPFRDFLVNDAHPHHLRGCYRHFLALKNTMPQLCVTIEAHGGAAAAAAAPALEVISFSQWHEGGGADAIVAPPKQRELCAEFDKLEVDRLSDLLERDDSFGAAWLLSNCYKGSARFLSLGENPVVTLSAAAVQTNLRLRLLLPAPASTSTPGARVQCLECNQHEEDDADEVGREASGRLDPRFHGLVCRKGQGLRIRRHNAVVRAVAAYMGRALGEDKVSTTEADLYLGEGPKKADIRLHTTQGYVFLDISVVHPACDTYVNGRAAACSSNTLLAAANRMWEHKRKQGHLQFLNRHINALPVVFPIVFETTGNLCVESATFLSQGILSMGTRQQFQGATVASNYDWLLRRCRTAIAMANHEAVCSFFQRSRTLVGPQHRVLPGPADVSIQRDPNDEDSEHEDAEDLFAAQEKHPRRVTSFQSDTKGAGQSLVSTRPGHECYPDDIQHSLQLIANFQSHSSSSSSSTSSTSAGCLLGSNTGDASLLAPELRGIREK